jgi:hypothetical protein
MNDTRTEFFQCHCFSDEHTLKFTLDGYEGADYEVSTSVFLNQYHNFWGRLWIAVTKQINDAITHFWGASANNDWAEHYYHMANKDKRLANVVTWEKSSAEDPLFPLKVEWESFKKLKDFIEYALVGGEDQVSRLPTVLTEDMKAVLDQADEKPRF